MGFLMAIAGCIAAGLLIAYAVVLTMSWLKDKIKELLKKENVKKVVVAEMATLAEKCENTMSFSEFEKFDEVIATVDSNGEVEHVELVTDENRYTDSDVERLLGKEGMVVITG